MKDTINLRRAAHWRRLVLYGAGILALLYAVLFIPDRKHEVPKGAGKQPFVWNQDALWAELEQQLEDARHAGCASLTDRLDKAMAELDRLSAEISSKSLDPENETFLEMEKTVFGIAPLLGACPGRLSEFAAKINRARTNVKNQSERWDLNSPEARQRLYRLLFGMRMALEEVMLQAPTEQAAPEFLLCDDEPSQTPGTRLLGVTVHSGDILVSRGGAPTSALIARGNDYPGSFSHVALVHVDEKSGSASVIESHIERGVAVSSLQQYLDDKKLRIMVLRLRADLPVLSADPLIPHKAATGAKEAVRTRHIPYDFTMNYRDHGSQFCSEVASAAYEAVGVKLWMGVSFISSRTVTAWLASLGAEHFETQEPSDLEYDPQLRVVAEWRDRSTLFKAHVDDAVTDVMLEEAKPNEGLGYSRLMLPPARLSKGYSVVLNWVGKIGPVPEGMSAVTALRVRRYRDQHVAIANQVLVLAEEFEKKHGYRPPYWKLITLAKIAKSDVKQRIQ